MQIPHPRLVPWLLSEVQLLHSLPPQFLCIRCSGLACRAHCRKVTLPTSPCPNAWGGGVWWMTKTDTCPTPKPALGHLLRRPTPFLPQTSEGSGNVLCSGFCHLTERCELGQAQASHPLETPRATLRPPSITRPSTEEEEWGTSGRVPHSQETGPSAFQHTGGTPGRACRALLSRTFVAATRPVSL